MDYLTNIKSKSLFKAIVALDTETEAKNFLADLLTPVEIIEFANRWTVAQMLNDKRSYEEITKETGMSSTTIARISKWLTSGMGGYKTMIKRLNKSQTHHHTSLAPV